MPEGEPSQFDPDHSIDESSSEPIKPTTETEPSLEQLKDPKFWEQEFQKSWEAKAGEEKSRSGLKEIRAFYPPRTARVIGIDRKGRAIIYRQTNIYDSEKRHPWSHSTENNSTCNSYSCHDFVQAKIGDLNDIEEQPRSAASHERLSYETKLKTQCTNVANLPDGIKVAARAGVVCVGDEELKLSELAASITFSDNFPARLFEISVGCTSTGLAVIAPMDGTARIWSSPFYAGYWSELDSYQGIPDRSIPNRLRQAIEDITNMPLERIQGIQIDSAIQTFSQIFPNKKIDRETWQNCTDIASAFRQGFEAWKNQEVHRLPRPAETPGPSVETLPRPANPDEENSSFGFPPARE